MRAVRRTSATATHHWPSPIHSKRVTYSTRMHEPEPHTRGRSHAQTCLRGVLSTAPPARGVLCARLAPCRHCVLHIIVGTASGRSGSLTLFPAATGAPLSPAALMYTTWRLCPRAAPRCRSSVTDAATQRRSCKLLNRQRSAMEPTDRLGITAASRADGLDHDGRIAAAVLGCRIMSFHRRGGHGLREGRVSPLPTVHGSPKVRKRVLGFRPTYHIGIPM